MSVELESPPQTEERREWSLFFRKLYQLLGPETGHILPVKTDVTRGDAGEAGRVIFNSDDGTINVDNGTAWTDSDGNVT